MQDLLMIFIVFLKLSSPQLKTNIFSFFEFKTEVFSTVICSLKNRLASYLSSRSGFHVLKVTSTVLLWIDQVFIFVPNSLICKAGVRFHHPHRRTTKCKANKFGPNKYPPPQEIFFWQKNFLLHLRVVNWLDYIHWALADPLEKVLKEEPWKVGRLFNNMLKA